jgi:hypothetical protein
MLGVTSRGITKQTNILEIGSKQNIVQSIKKFLLNWKDAKRMKDSRLPKLAYFNIKGKRNVGRPRNKWHDEFQCPELRNVLEKTSVWV